MEDTKLNWTKVRAIMFIPNSKAFSLKEFIKAIKYS